MGPLEIEPREVLAQTLGVVDGAPFRRGNHFIELARQDMKRHFINLPHRDLAYLVEGTEHFDDYVEAMQWAQDYAAENRRTMMDAVLRVLREEIHPVQLGAKALHGRAARGGDRGSRVPQG
ncbi:MAG TPA: RtcB family protein [Steroidobacteraceae bacterium]